MIYLSLLKNKKVQDRKLVVEGLKRVENHWSNGLCIREKQKGNEIIREVDKQNMMMKYER